MLTPLQALLFAALPLMVLVWFACVSSLSRQLRDRHAEKYDEMGLEDMWPKNLAGWFAGHNNSGPVMALLRFLLKSEHRELHDAAVSSLAVFLRRFFYLYLVLFAALVFSLLSGFQKSASKQGAGTIGVESPEQRREKVFAPYRAQKWAEVLTGYDALRPESERDSELTYWRGMAHWQLQDTVRALQDFRRAIELDPGYFEAYRNADRILSVQQRWDEILELWDSYLWKTPNNAEAYFERGGTHFHKGNLPAAHADVTRACELGKAEACGLADRLKPK